MRHKLQVKQTVQKKWPNVVVRKSFVTLNNEVIMRAQGEMKDEWVYLVIIELGIRELSLKSSDLI